MRLPLQGRDQTMAAAVAGGLKTWKGAGASLQLVVALTSHSCREAPPGCAQQKTRQHHSTGHCPPPAPASASKARRAAEPSQAATAAASSSGHQTGPVEGVVDPKSYLWARYQEMKKLVYGKQGRSYCLQG